MSEIESEDTSECAQSDISENEGVSSDNQNKNKNQKSNEIESGTISKRKIVIDLKNAISVMPSNEVGNENDEAKVDPPQETLEEEPILNDESIKTMETNTDTITNQHNDSLHDNEDLVQPSQNELMQDINKNQTTAKDEKDATTAVTTVTESATVTMPATTVTTTPASTSTEQVITESKSESNELTENRENNEYAEHITYTDDGEAIYTDPKTQYKYKWSTKENSWIYFQSDENALVNKNNNNNTATDNPYENEHYKWCHERNQWIPKIITNPNENCMMATAQTETEFYKWDATKNAWIPKIQNQPLSEPTATAVATEADKTSSLATEQATHATAISYGIDEDGQRVYTDKDGAVFFWDPDKSAWFPKIDDDFMARYQMNYGFIDNTSASEEERKLREEVESKRKEAELRRMTEEAQAAARSSATGVGAGVTNMKRKTAQEPPAWFDLNPEQNTKVYVSNLPLDITLDEFAEVMSKCGMIMRDPQTQKIKLKLYTEADGQIKGDGLCDYIKVESVDLALKILDEYVLRGHKIRVQRAQFQMRGEYNPALKPKRKKKDKEKLQKMKEKLFDWRPEKLRGERSKNEKIVIIKNLFSPEIFEKEVQLILDYQNDLREECGKCGTVRKVIIYDLHPEGVAQVNMSCPEEADVVIKMMHGRYFGQRLLTAEHWDGKTKYKISETETAAKSRLNNWDSFLESEAEKKQQ